MVLTPRRWRQVSGGDSANDGGKKARSPGRARRKPLKPLRRECRVNRCDRGDYARVLFYFAREAAGASGARHSLRPLIREGGTFPANLGAMRREIAKLCLQKLCLQMTVFKLKVVQPLRSRGEAKNSQGGPPPTNPADQATAQPLDARQYRDTGRSTGA